MSISTMPNRVDISCLQCSRPPVRDGKAVTSIVSTQRIPDDLKKCPFCGGQVLVDNTIQDPFEFHAHLELMTRVH